MVNTLVSGITEKMGERLKQLRLLQLNTSSKEWQRVASMKLGQRVRRVDSTGELASKLG